ncbi:MAG: hypothetical protein PVJ64_00490 [Gemmatimonadales bacterium]
MKLDFQPAEVTGYTAAPLFFAHVPGGVLVLHPAGSLAYVPADSSLAEQPDLDPSSHWRLSASAKAVHGLGRSIYQDDTSIVQLTLCGRRLTARAQRVDEEPVTCRACLGVEQ